MYKKSKIKVLLIVINLFLILSLVGCISADPDKAKIMQIAKNIEKAIKDKDVDLFMENISYNYSGPNNETYEDVEDYAEEVISQIELAEELAGSIPGLTIVTDVSISDLVIFDQYASGKMEINISLKICVWFVCTPIPGIDAEESMLFDVDFVKEGNDWKIISLIEI